MAHNLFHDNAGFLGSFPFNVSNPARASFLKGVGGGGPITIQSAQAPRSFISGLAPNVRSRLEALPGPNVAPSPVPAALPTAPVVQTRFPITEPIPMGINDPGIGIAGGGAHPGDFGGE